MLSSNGSDGNHSKPLRLRRVNHSDEVVIGFSKLLKTESMTDVTLICSGGQTIRAHRVILSTFSPYFRAIFESQPFSNNPCQYPVIVIKDLALSELRTIVEFIYKGEVSVSRDKLSTVLQAAKELEVSGLSDLKVDGHKCSVQMQMHDDQCSINSSGRRKSKTPRKTITSDYIGYIYQNGGGGLTDKHDDDDPVILKPTMDDVSDYIDEDDMNGDHDDYETTNGSSGGIGGSGIDRDIIFQRQQQLRLQQLQQQQKYHHHHQSQQQKYQQQIQLQLLQERQEAKLLELHQQLRQVSGLGSSNDTIIPDQDDSTPGLNCSDGYNEESFPLITDLRTGNSSSSSTLTNGNGHHDKNGSGNNNNNSNSNGGDGSNNNSTTNGKPATPDFLQPRGPGRPRKGNKSNDISPCPECNKVFVRPDVLKLHYRSVHLNERHPCNMCPKIFKWPGDLSKHKRTKHSEAMAALNAKIAAAIS